MNKKLAPLFLGTRAAWKFLQFGKTEDLLSNRKNDPSFDCALAAFPGLKTSSFSATCSVETSARKADTGIDIRLDIL